MKLIKNIRKRRIEKYKARLKAQYIRETESRMKKLEDEFRRDMARIEKRNEERLLQKDKWLEQEIKIIRDQERRKYDPIIHEREVEIEKLRGIINDSREYVETMKNREYLLEDTARSAVGKFERGLEKIREGIQSMLSAQSEIETYNRKQIKGDKKIELKEV